MWTAHSDHDRSITKQPVEKIWFSLKRDQPLLMDIKGRSQWEETSQESTLCDFFKIHNGCHDVRIHTTLPQCCESLVWCHTMHMRYSQENPWKFAWHLMSIVQCHTRLSQHCARLIQVLYDIVQSLCNSINASWWSHDRIMLQMQNASQFTPVLQYHKIFLWQSQTSLKAH